MWAPYDPVSYFLHVGFGLVAVTGALTALTVRKGSPLHQKAGWTFVVPMAVAATTALIFEAEFDQPRPLAVLSAVATLYLLSTSLLSLKNGWRYAALFEKLLVLIPIVLLVTPALVLSRSIQSGLSGPVLGPALHGVIFLSLVIGDIRLFLNRPSDRLYWIRRHLFRMLLAAAFAIRAVFSFGIEVGVPFELVFTAPPVLALLATWYFFRKLRVLI